MQPDPVRSLNTSPLNPYVGRDRGLFSTRRPDYPFARIRTAKWVCLGPTPSPGHLTFTLMGYTTLPTTPTEYAAGVPLLNSSGSQDFDCMTRGPVYEPIIAEFFATEVFFKHYLTGGDMVADKELQNGEGIARRFVVSMGGAFGITDCKVEVLFSQGADGLPIKRDSVTVTYVGVKDGKTVNSTVVIDGDPVDPVLFAIENIKTLV